MYVGKKIACKVSVACEYFRIDDRKFDAQEIEASLVRHFGIWKTEQHEKLNIAVTDGFTSFSPHLETTAAKISNSCQALLSLP
jgi:hypothetical protein